MKQSFYEQAVLGAMQGILSNPKRDHMTPFKVAELAVQVAQQLCMAAGHPAKPKQFETAGKKWETVREHMLLESLERHPGDMPAVAKELGISNKTVYNWIDAMNGKIVAEAV